MKKNDSDAQAKCKLIEILLNMKYLWAMRFNYAILVFDEIVECDMVCPAENLLSMAHLWGRYSVWNVVCSICARAQLQYYCESKQIGWYASSHLIEPALWCAWKIYGTFCVFHLRRKQRRAEKKNTESKLNASSGRQTLNVAPNFPRNCNK